MKELPTVGIVSRGGASLEITESLWQRRQRQRPRPQRQSRGRFVIHDVPVPLLFFLVCNLLCHDEIDAVAFTSYQRPGRRLRVISKRERTHASINDNDNDRYRADHNHSHGSLSASDLEDDKDDSNNVHVHFPASYNNKMVVSRRASLAASASALGLAATLIPATSATASTFIDIDDTSSESDNQYPAATSTSTIPSLTIPLQYQPNLSAYTIAYKVGTSQFGAIIDTGSPFLLVPASSETSCRPEYRWGCFHPEESRPAAGLGPTLERFDGNEGVVEWREGTFSFDMAAMNDERNMSSKKDDSAASLSLSTLVAANAAEIDVAEDTSSLPSNDDAASESLLFPRSLMTFGVISESLMDGPGGIFLGLVKNTNKRIRPSFLGQSDVSAFSVDLREREGMAKALTLYGSSDAGKATTEAKSNKQSSLFPSNKIDSTRTHTNLDGMLNNQENTIPLVRDLNKRYGDPTIHYVGVASSITVNGYNLASTSRRSGKIYCIFDTGCSGMSISPSLFDERYATARARKEKNLFGTVDVEFTTTSGETVTLNAKRPITTPLGSDRPWGKKLDGHLIVLGLAFLDGIKMTVDIDGENILFED